MNPWTLEWRVQHSQWIWEVKKIEKKINQIKIFTKRDKSTSKKAAGKTMFNTFCFYHFWNRFPELWGKWKINNKVILVHKCHPRVTFDYISELRNVFLFGLVEVSSDLLFLFSIHWVMADTQNLRTYALLKSKALRTQLRFRCLNKLLAYQLNGSHLNIYLTLNLF